MSPVVHRIARGGGHAPAAAPAPDPDPGPEDPEPGDILLHDTFTRADGALGTSTSGHVWEHTGWTVAGNTGKPPTSGGYQVALLDAGQLDVSIEVTIDPNEAPDMGVVFRGINATNWAMLNIGVEGDHWLCRVHQRIAGGFGTPLTALVNPIPILGTNLAAPFDVRIEAIGASGEVFVNEVSQGSWSGSLDAALATGTKCGLMGNDVTSSRFTEITVYAA